MVYTLNNRFVDLMQGVLVVGCGGTGGFVAEGLCRLLSRRVNIVLMDQDVVETTNLLRQNFYPADLGKFKAQVLAERLSQQFNRRVGYSLHYAKTEVGIFAHPDPLSRYYLIIGCVDNHLARQAIQCIPQSSFEDVAPGQHPLHQGPHIQFAGDGQSTSISSYTPAHPL